MKKILLLTLLFSLCMVSCIEEGEKVTYGDLTKTYLTGTGGGDFYMFEVTWKGHSHVFLNTQFGIVHWPDCPYCKKDGM